MGIEYLDGQNHLNIDVQYYNGLDIAGFSQMLKDPSYCYKFYWLEAIVKLISRNVKQTSYNDIIDEMICNAWYTVLEFHVHLSGIMLGEARDGLERAVLTLQAKSGLRADASPEQIRNEIRNYEADLKPYKDQLTKNVPYRALAGFFDNEKGTVNWGRTGAVMDYAQALNVSRPLPYVFGKSTGLNREIYFNDAWIQMIQDNTVSILGWIQFEKVKWLQSNNPEVPSLVYKLAPMDDRMRKLNHVRDLWECILELQQIIDVFKDTPIERGKYDIDHFIPWSFVMNDELWNLMPMDSSLNSSKSNKLPKWDTYFGKYANNQFILYGMINDDSKPQIHKKFESCFKDNLHSIWGGELYQKGKTKDEFCNLLKKNMAPVYDSAMRQGYQVW
ncbi:HNH endonuclease [Pseudobutyrivibrio sp. YE44]|uniref:HNH endonuclease domain-containing protein n=1 Tax=Pseudobutyrivibrio sp. YE44 TaxID=1520802 RepID=UPI00087E0020|nr:HNH endonuclease domain-containing protein [Pseudobutyrivibrio sp. YE44]SDB07589.1 HNH endonuclease [Pseudobutyrivibrio sp. YE44]